MEFEINFKGLEGLTKTMKELERALSDLDGDIAHLTFDAHDPQSIENAIREFNSAVDQKIAGYSQNDLVAHLVEELKESGRTTILEQAALARLEGGNDE